MYSLSEKEFLQLTSKGNLIPVYQEINGDMETPVSAYLKISEGSKYSFLLESVEGEEKIARYSFLAKDPQMVIHVKGKNLTLTEFNKGKTKKTKKILSEGPIEFIRQIMKPYRFVQQKGLPRFCGGLVGTIGYDVVRFFEKLPNNTKDDLNLPDILLILAKDLLIFDHIRHKIKVVSCVDVPNNLSQKEKVSRYNQSLKRIDSLIDTIIRPLSSKNKRRRIKGKSVQLRLKSNVKETQFESMVEAAKKEITNGEIIQVVLSQRFETSLKTDAFNIYRRLRSLNPSPYMFFLNFDGLQLIGSSPELLVRCEEGVVETRPIAGTRKRGANIEEDHLLMKDLLNDPKEKAEHIMLVDLGRNDLGRVCEKGSVEVTDFMSIEKYSHVMHIVSNVRGKLDTKKDAFDVLQAAFPAGTVTGAPKIRAMEIIEDLEKVKRGPYAGCIAYVSFSGNLDSCITIRTVIAKNNKAYTQAGAGIVADSEAQKEFQETVNKAKAQIRAIELAHQQID